MRNVSGRYETQKVVNTGVALIQSILHAKGREACRGISPKQIGQGQRGRTIEIKVLVAVVVIAAKQRIVAAATVVEIVLHTL